MKKKLMAIAMTAAMVGSLTACGGGAKETTAAPTEAAKTEAAETEAKAEESKEADAGSGKADGDLITVGYAQVGAESDWRTANTESFKSTFTEENGYKLIFDDAQQKQENQIKAIRSFMEDQGRGDEEINMVTIQGTIGASAQVGRTEGMDNKLKEHSNWKMLDRQSGEFTQAKGQEVMESFLKSYPDIDVVICENDNEAFGAIDAIHAAGKTCGPNGDIIVVSFDSVKAAFESMIKGDLNATFECNPLHGPRVAEIIQKLEKGEQVDKVQYVDEAYFDTSMDLENILKDRAY